MQQDGPRVVGIATAGHQAFLFHVVDQAGKGGDLDRGGERKIAHAAAVPLAQSRQHAPGLQAGAQLTHLLAERRGDARAGAVQQIGQVIVKRPHGHVAKWGAISRMKRSICSFTWACGLRP